MANPIRPHGGVRRELARLLGLGRAAEKRLIGAFLIDDFRLRIWRPWGAQWRTALGAED